MGKPFAKELAALKETYEWARGVASDPLVEFVGEAYARPLLAVGSGGWGSLHKGTHSFTE
jgi:hypothetical protein